MTRSVTREYLIKEGITVIKHGFKLFDIFSILLNAAQIDVAQSLSTELIDNIGETEGIVLLFAVLGIDLDIDALDYL